MKDVSKYFDMYWIVKERIKRTTKAEVIRYMRGDSAVNSTHHLIMDLIKEGKLNVEVLNSQVHFLTINEENAFNRIDAGLIAFEAGVNAMFTSLSELYKKSYKATGIVDDFSTIDIPELSELRNNFNETVQSFLVIIGRTIRSEEDVQILYGRIQEILQKGPPGFWSPEMVEAAKPLQSLSQRVAHFNKQVQMSLDKKEKQSKKSKPK